MSNAAAAAQEPTMEEILASIRRIVADDEPEAADAPSGANAGNVLDLTTEMMEAPEETFPIEPAPMPEHEMMPAPAAPAQPPAGPDATASDLMSSAAGNAVASAFGNLNHLVMSQNARTLDDIVTEMMKPMLREWLDDNLPPLVERLVKDEIQRISRAQ